MFLKGLSFVIFHFGRVWVDLKGLVRDNVHFGKVWWS